MLLFLRDLNILIEKPRGFSYFFFFLTCEHALIRSPMPIKTNKKKKVFKTKMRKTKKRNENDIQKWLKQEKKRSGFMSFYWAEYGLLV